MEIPKHLASDFSILEKLSYALKKRNPDIKRNIKFDDAFMGLMLDFNVDGTWKTVRPDQARQVTLASAGKNSSAGAESISVADLTDMVSGEGPPGK